MKNRKAYLVVELDADELASIPPHLRGLLERPLVDPLETRQLPRKSWFPTEEEKRKQRRDEMHRRQRERAKGKGGK